MAINYHAKLESGNCYHIYNRAVGTDNLFMKPKHFDYFIERWKKYISPYFFTYAYCLMPNHFHFLAKTKPMTPKLIELIKSNPTRKAQRLLNGEASENDFYTSLFKAMFNSYSKGFNNDQDRHGSLFQAKFKRTLIKDENHFLEMLQYIHHNPIHHKFCENYEDWDYSSYHHYFSEEKDYLAKKVVLDTFGSLDEFVKSHFLYKKEFVR
jgi:putative transposase